MQIFVSPALYRMNGSSRSQPIPPYLSTPAVLAQTWVSTLGATVPTREHLWGAQGQDDYARTQRDWRTRGETAAWKSGAFWGKTASCH